MPAALCLPGDLVPLDGAPRGPGLDVDMDTDETIAVAAGIVKYSGEGVFVENLRKRYIPRKGDRIVGIIISRGMEMYKVDIRAPQPAWLSVFSFNSATKRNRPVLEVGSLVYARVDAVALQPDAEYQTELSCVDPELKKSWNTGEVLYRELQGGINFEVALVAAQRLLAPDCYVIERLGEHFPFEICTGDNGRVWLKAATARETVLLLQAIRRSFGLTDVQTEALVAKMVQIFS
eukprot:NODE_15574_length_1043_cov_2.293668.p1 GENE.NODE_15574_length_1043_cov_2.293668~~NODE_15574_length_1043_cov_2.293668.p1  ORF type:complete len:246 (-),score=92.90 NODE_15574_length_1043_cov_2.293668:305-1006(-)